MSAPTARAGALGAVAGALAAAGDRAGARSVIRESGQALGVIGQPASRSLARQRLMDDLSEGGDFAQADLAALAHGENRDVEEDLRRVARARTEAGDPHGARQVLAQAEPLVLAIIEPDARAWALSSLAADLAAVGAVDDAIRLLVEATRTSPWYRCLATAAGVAPHAVRAVGEDLITSLE